MHELELKETRNSLYFWNIITTIIFAVLIVKIVDAIGIEAVRTIASISPYHFILVSFATFRLTRLFVADHITQWLRDLCMKSVTVKDPLTGVTFVRCEKPIKGLRLLISDFLGCPWCVGVWMALVSIILYYVATIELFPVAWLIILVFATAGAGELVYAATVALLAPHMIMGFPLDQKGANLLGGAKRPQEVLSANVCEECGVSKKETN